MTWANDDLASAAALSGASGSITPLPYDGSSDPATSEVGETPDGAGETLWWAWTAPSSGTFFFTTFGSPSTPPSSGGLDTILTVYEGPASSPTFAGLTFVALNDDGGGTYRLNSQTLFTAVAGTTYYIVVDQYSTGQAGTLHLSWGPYVPPPSAGSWVSSGTIAAHTLLPGDDATVTGTQLGAVSGATVGGVSQPFTVTSSTQVVVHVNGSALSGPIVLSNAGGSDAATGDALMLYPGPWLQPPDETAVLTSPTANAYFKRVNVNSQPEPGGALEDTLASSDFDFQVDGPYVSIEYTFNFRGTIVNLDSRDTDAAMPGVGADYLALESDPHAVNFQDESTVGVEDGDLTIHFGSYAEGNWVDDSNGRTTAEDLWQPTVEFRRLEDADWTYRDVFVPVLAAGAWPLQATVAALPLDFSRPVVDHGGAVTISSAGSGPWVNNQAVLAGESTYTDEGGLVMSWADLGAGKAWLVAFSNWIDTAAIAPPVVDPSPALWCFSGHGHVKGLHGHARLVSEWPYTPPRYRILYDSPRHLAATTLRRRQQAAAVGSAPRRRQIANRTGSLRRGPGAAP